MGVLADYQIRKEVKITPYAKSKKREGKISYGETSYGYDLRLGYKYRIFSNALCTLVDPKRFDESAFVEHQGKFCIIPPNSFVLAESLETLEIPRDIQTICVGKSTYARCFTGDTRVALVDGRSPTFVELETMQAQGAILWGYGIKDGKVVVQLLENVRKVGRDQILEILLDNGEMIKTTKDHLFVRRDSSLCEAAILKPGDSLMPLYRKHIKGYEFVMQPVSGQYVPTHWLSDEWNVMNGFYEAISGQVRHHIDLNKINNSPMNIERLTTSAHTALHNEHRFSDTEARLELLSKMREGWKKAFEDPEWRRLYLESQSRKAKLFWEDPCFAEARRRMLEKRGQSVQAHENRVKAWNRRYASEEAREVMRQSTRKSWENASKERREKQAEIARSIRGDFSLTSERVRAALKEAGTLRGAARLLGHDRSIFRRFPVEVEEWRLSKLKSGNHRIISIRELPEEDVWCLTAPETSNFALAAGVFVTNCGILAHVTPLEPCWRGKVTIEISNATPLPVKVYSGEGILQVLFFRADGVTQVLSKILRSFLVSEVARDWAGRRGFSDLSRMLGQSLCQISYADKNGRYQDQRGLTLPFVEGVQRKKRKC